MIALSVGGVVLSVATVIIASRSCVPRKFRETYPLTCFWGEWGITFGLVPVVVIPSIAVAARFRWIEEPYYHDWHERLLLGLWFFSGVCLIGTGAAYFWERHSWLRAAPLARIDRVAADRGRRVVLWGSVGFLFLTALVGSWRMYEGANPLGQIASVAFMVLVLAVATSGAKAARNLAALLLLGSGAVRLVLFDSAAAGWPLLLVHDAAGIAFGLALLFLPNVRMFFAAAEAGSKGARPSTREPAGRRKG
jgi:hypothetical protein